MWGKGEERYKKRHRENGEDMRENGRGMKMQRYWKLKGQNKCKKGAISYTGTRRRGKNIIFQGGVDGFCIKI
jgi:hypothetical protein